MLFPLLMLFPLPGKFFPLLHPRDIYLSLVIEFSWNFLWEVFPDFLRPSQHLTSTKGYIFRGLTIAPYLVCLPYWMRASERKSALFPEPSAASGTDSFHEFC